MDVQHCQFITFLASNMCLSPDYQTIFLSDLGYGVGTIFGAFLSRGMMGLMIMGLMILGLDGEAT